MPVPLWKNRKIPGKPKNAACARVLQKHGFLRVPGVPGTRCRAREKPCAPAARVHVPCGICAGTTGARVLLLCRVCVLLLCCYDDDLCAVP